MRSAYRWLSTLITAHAVCVRLESRSSVEVPRENAVLVRAGPVSCETTWYPDLAAGTDIANALSETSDGITFVVQVYC